MINIESIIAFGAAVVAYRSDRHWSSMRADLAQAVYAAWQGVPGDIDGPPGASSAFDDIMAIDDLLSRPGMSAEFSRSLRQARSEAVIAFAETFCVPEAAEAEAAQ